MDMPTPPQDIGIRHIIHKLAEFVARHGPEFEAITKAKQNGNPKFSFLYGGLHYSYYMYKVAAEQALIKQQHSQIQNQTSIPSLLSDFSQTQVWSNPPPANTQSATVNATTNSNVQIENINLQQIALREQIRQSEQNLQGQHGVLMQQQQTQIDEEIIKAQDDLIQNQADELNIIVKDFDVVLQPIIDSCTKDSISSGKSWILQHSSDSAKCNVISKYLLKKALINGAGFSQKLHLIYLINDVLHHCVRKNADELKKNLENVVIPMFCSAELIASEEQRHKLHKLLTLWESKANFFDACVMSKLRSPTSSMQEYKTNLLSVHGTVVNNITQTIKSQFESYQQQHQAFIQHASQQIALLEAQKQSIEQQTLTALVSTAASQLINPTISDSNQSVKNGDLIFGNNQITPTRTQSNTTSSIPPLMGIVVTPPAAFNTTIYQGGSSNHSFSSGNSSQNSNDNNSGNCSNTNNNNNNAANSGNNLSTDYTLPPPNFQIPDLSKPPPGFAPVVETSTEDLTPYVPYFELPAGLMVPLIRLEDCGYKPLDSTLIKLPPPTLPNERLVSAVEAFYSKASHDRPRDGDGWEKLGLYEYYKVKNAAKKQKEEEIEGGIREKSRSPSPIVIELARPKRKKRCYRSRSRSRSKSRSRSISPASPPPEIRRNFGPTRVQRSVSPPPKQRSPSPNRNPSPPYRRDRSSMGAINNKTDKNSSVNNLNDRENSMSPPPSFFGGNYNKAVNEHIEESNKGHQMLMKMGWGGTGTGLGVQGQGIDAPISGGDVRNRQDLYKGIGININDPYENFRKNKGVDYKSRMKARAEERS